MLFVGALLAPVSAQVTLIDKAEQKVDLGFGVKQSEFLSTASFMTISGEELQQTSAISLADALYGRLLGLTALKTGGFAGDEGVGAILNIRRIQTFSETGILVMVDGYERPIDRLSVEEVESVTVLKDAAALAMFGHQAVNGAILVKTKRGSIGKTHVKVGYNHRFSFDPEFMDMVDGHDYAASLNKARINDGLAPTYTQQELDLIKAGTDPYFYPNVDWRSHAFKDVASEDRAYLSVYGGTEKIQYYTIVDYTDSRGLLKGTEQADYSSQLKYSKANIRANMDMELSPTTNMSVDVLGIFMETNRPDGVSANGAYWLVNTTPASAFPYKTSTGVWGGNETYGDATYGDANIAARIQESGFSKTHQRQLWANAKLTQELSFWVEGLSFSVGAGYDNASNTTERRYKGRQYGYEYYTGAIGDKGNVAEVTYGNKQDNLIFGHGVDLQWRILQSFLGFHYNTSFTSDDNFAASVVYTAKNRVTDGQHNTVNRANWMGSFHYDYKNKYIADLVLAANGSSRSYPAKWSFSPVLSLGYIYANNSDDFLTYGKLRGSAGIQHTDYVPDGGIWLENWVGYGGSVIFGQGYSENWGSFLGYFPTKNFSQEKAAKFNLGTDIRLFNAVDITLEGFYQQRSHILHNAENRNSRVVGIYSSFADEGGVKSYGVEAGARFTKKIGNDLYFNSAAMVTWSINKVTDFIENPAFKNLSFIDFAVNEAWGLEAIGLFKDQNDIDNSPRQEFSEVRPGDIKYKDVNGDGVINEFDRKSLGSRTYIPDLNYAFNLGLEYKGFGINAWFQGTGNYMKNFMYEDGAWGVISDNRNLSKDYYNNSWDIAGASAKYPRFTSQYVPNNEQSSTVWLQKVNFFKLRDCELYYKLPQSTVQKLNLSGIKVYVQGQNLLSFDNVDALDAEVLSTGVYPLMKSVNLGLNVTF